MVEIQKKKEKKGLGHGIISCHKCQCPFLCNCQVCKGCIEKNLAKKKKRSGN